MKSVYPIFHISQLELSDSSTILNRVQPSPPPIKVDGEVEYEVEEILNSKIYWRMCHYLFKPKLAGSTQSAAELLKYDPN